MAGSRAVIRGTKLKYMRADRLRRTDIGPSIMHPYAESVLWTRSGAIGHFLPNTRCGRTYVWAECKSMESECLLWVKPGLAKRRPVASAVQGRAGLQAEKADKLL